MNRQMIELESAKQPFKMMLTVPGYVEDLIMLHRGWEPYLAREMNKWIADGGIFIDVGANIGYHTLYMAASNPSSLCLAFEPHPRIFHEFVENIRLSGLNNIKAYNLAVSCKSGTIPFYLQEESCYNRALSSAIRYDVLKEGTVQAEVPVVVLDDMLDKAMIKRVHVLKIDTQGFEYEVMKGAKKIIDLSRPVITFEYHPYSSASLPEILELLNDYSVCRIFSWLGGIKTFDETDPEMYVDDLDLLCIPNERLP